MAKELTLAEEIGRTVFTRFRKELWSPFVNAIHQYELIQPGDHIAVCISGGKDSMLMAKLMQMYQGIHEIPFEVTYLVMDPGYNEFNRKKIEENAKTLDIPITIFETNIFAVANNQTRNPCYLCARMRRGHLYNAAKNLGCNKIALGHHLNDAIETVVMAMLNSSKLETIIPKARSENFEGMELIRPLYRVKEDNIIRWCQYNGLEFIQCACRFTENAAACGSGGGSKRKEAKELIRSLKEKNPEVEDNIFRSLHAVQMETFPGYKADGSLHSFTEDYNTNPTGKFTRNKSSEA
ncbi:MAG: tRNA 2-thiocytidine biosynthesis protein TtcA [Solobacterium sp.]|nr:tRNA 2-thiocytidine biosynthesis protein TtcA [Solobacterium sp.]